MYKHPFRIVLLDGAIVCNHVATLICLEFVIIFASMKFLFLVMSCLMLYLSCLPCNDSNECAASAPSAISAANDHKQHDHSEETCSPFCTCSCCSIAVFHLAFLRPQFEKAVVQVSKHHLRNVVFNTAVYYAIWQPPQLV